jgi:hypothetical protein
MGAETVGTLTHADTPHWGNERPAQRHASRVRLSRFKIDLNMKIFFGAPHAGQICVRKQIYMREQIRMTLSFPVTSMK